MFALSVYGIQKAHKNKGSLHMFAMGFIFIF